jgi:outer membrane receptor protein involved in Fe transport
LYSVTAEKQGFKTIELDTVLLEVNQKLRLDLTAQVGQTQESITVTGSASQVQSNDASVGYRLDNQSIKTLPLDGRNVVSLVTLGPGAIPRQLGGFTHDVINDVQENRGAVALNPPINGARSTMNIFLLDGALNTDLNVHAIAITPPLESVQEFRIQTSLPSAEFAQSGGGIGDVVTRSGGQKFHGSGFEFFRNEAMDARNLFDDPTLARPVFRQNQFGGSIGGPLKIPATFIFATYEGVRAREAKSALNIVPDAALRSGDFSSRSPIFNPFKIDPVTGQRQQFANNVIPPNLIDPIARKFLDMFEPLPNRPDATSNYLDATPNDNVRDNVSVRIDHELRDHSRIFGRYTINDDRNRLASSFPERPTDERVKAQQIVLGHSLAGASWVNELRLSFTRLSVLDIPESAFQADIIRQLGITDFPSDPANFGLPFFEVADFSMVTDSTITPQTQRDSFWHLSEGLTLVRGPHALKFGAQFVRFQLNYLQSELSRGEYNFTGAFTSNPASTDSTGDAFADFLLGLPQSTNRSIGNAQAYLRQTTAAGYAQDDWRITNRLTLNLGLRYEYFSPFSETRSNLLNLDYSNLPKPPTLKRSTSAVEPNTRNIAPRIGLAWSPSLAPLAHRDFVIRAGYGIYFSPEIAKESYDLVRNGILNQSNQTDGTAAPVLTIANGFPQSSSTGLPSYFGLDPHAATPYMQQWSLGVQQRLPFGIISEVAYVGSKGTHLGRSRTFNTPAHIETRENLPPRPGDLQSLRTFPELGGLIQREHSSSSSYNSLQFKAQKQMSQRLGLLASFVWSKSIDDSDSVLNGLFDSITAQDERNLRLERGLSFFNVGRRVSVGFLYNVPRPPHLKALLADWSLSGILTLQDGTPVNPVYFATDFANSGTMNRPNVVPGQSVTLPRSQRSADVFFNTAAFSDPKPFTFGDAGRDTIPGPGNNLLDLALLRRVHIREAGTIEFRAEIFNFFNHPNYGIPGPYPDFGPFFGKIFSTGDPRRIQLGLRFDF